MNKYKETRAVKIGGHNGIREILVGGKSPVTIQTMWKEGIADVVSDKDRLDSILRQINTLKSLGCDIIRFAVPDMESAKGLCAISSQTDVPLVADIHFDYRLALECLKGEVSAIRINPGNIGSVDRVKAVASACLDKGVAIRIGVNSGSLPKDLADAVDCQRLSRASALAKAAMREAEVFDSLSFRNVVVSMKSSDVQETIQANEAFASQSDIPLHIGVTEAGPLISGLVKSTLAFSHLLKEGIGSTIRVSLSSSPENEVLAAREILHECGLRQEGVTIVSCPRCGRLGFDVHSFVERWQNELYAIKKPLVIAVMGCVVNGPGEGRHADLGIAGGGGKVIIFKKGKLVRTVDEVDADREFRMELEALIREAV
ncbi:MAG: flavodoxin-dependent (E)-4-hydroxy-3-methylbut-2-enyl-diphosphate synthase [Treponema sp.]|nr:flavodoxin-dependent (E)-4-hydroxy-3-methylbut-2-enyl-diphosphate synthase [Treponema sp.]